MISPMERNSLLFTAAVAVLKCPMSVEEKIATLEAALFPLLQQEFPYIPPTGLKPFDDAIQAYMAEMIDGNKSSS